MTQIDMKRILIGNLLCVSTLYMPSYTAELCYLSLCNFDIPFDPIFIKTIAASFFFFFGSSDRSVCKFNQASLVYVQLATDRQPFVAY